jgi:S-phase kinase-associated protein 1
MENGDKMVTMQVNDDNGNVLFEKDIAFKNLYHCVTIRNMINDLGAGEFGKEGEKFIIPLPSGNVKSPEHLDYVVQYAEFMRTAEFPKDERKEDARIDGVLTEWEKKFAESTPKNTLIEVVLLANFLEFNYMLEAMCCAMAGLMKDRTTEQIREDWGIKNDFTKEEEEKIKKENQFIEEAQERN